MTAKGSMIYNRKKVKRIMIQNNAAQTVDAEFKLQKLEMGAGATVVGAGSPSA